jgi:hypothetical protein
VAGALREGVERADGVRAVARAAAAALVTLAALSTPVTPAAAQGIRGTATTTVRYLSLRPLGMDTIPRGDVLGADGTFTFGGEPVYCPPSGGDCIRYRSLDEAHAVVATQDVSATAWGLGVRGLSATFLLRGRGDLGGDFDWPTADDEFDAILAYAQLQRSFYRIRAGRQRTLSGLGFSGFDGLDFMATPFPWLTAEAYGGRSLARGLYEPRHEALRPIEPFVLDQNAYLFGGMLELSPRIGTSLTARYQREIWADRVGLVSERASLDLRSDLPGPLRVNGSVDYDVALDRVGKAHLTLASRLPGAWGSLAVTGRRYLPYFDLTTIWGFFSPTPYHEAEVAGTLTRFRPFTLWASAGVREYGDPEIDVLGPPITDESRRYAVGARWAPRSVTISGEYRLETGFGAFLSSGDARFRWQASPALAVSVRGSAFQQIEQFRVGENTVLGAGVGAEVALPFQAELRAGADLYSQAYENRPGDTDWDQLRGHAILRIPFGEDPGLRGQP